MEIFLLAFFSLSAPSSLGWARWKKKRGEGKKTILICCCVDGPREGGKKTFSSFYLFNFFFPFPFGCSRWRNLLFYQQQNAHFATHMKFAGFFLPPPLSRHHSRPRNRIQSWSRVFTVCLLQNFFFFFWGFRRMREKCVSFSLAFPSWQRIKKTAEREGEEKKAQNTFSHRYTAWLRKKKKERKKRAQRAVVERKKKKVLLN